MSRPDESFQLPPDYALAFPHRSSRERYSMSASMKAAGNNDSRVLRAVLARRLASRLTSDRDIDPAKYTSWLREQQTDTFGPNSTVETPGQDPINTPLLEAIRCQLVENVDLLLEAGADPNGIDMETEEIYQTLFLRFRPSIPSYIDIDGDVADRETLLSCMMLPQTAPMTEEEIEQRAITVSPFWTFASATIPNRFPKGDEMHSLVVAARYHSTKILDRLLEAGADASSWTSQRSDIPESPTPSSLAISSPLHAAIAARNVGMIAHLLSRGFDPNFLPTSTPLTCLTPLMSTFLSCQDFNEATTESRTIQTSSTTSPLPSTFNRESYDVIIRHPSIRFTVASPILSVHAFHLAVAHASLPLFKHVLSTISISPSYVQPTALGHILLHIACLPPSTSYINMRSLATIHSIHDTRSLDMPRMRTLVTPSAPGSVLEYNLPATISDEEACRHFSAQTELLEFLILSQHQNVAEQDVYGNTALHYLAGHRVVNMEAVDLLRAADGGTTAWSEAKNRWGYAAKDLMAQVSDGIEGDKLVKDLLSENEKELKKQTRKIDEWWDEKLAMEWRKREYGEEQLGHVHDHAVVGNEGRGGRGRRGASNGRGRGGRCGECGRRLDSQIDEFPFHGRRTT
ncbi:hypothetical protein EG329_011266 [Mollisiaceae sp. DMI_Dod_QoI]|nr:hypothetical protein EG329_011266 [Helotiales sp. DMI_Dod_QoI]